MNAEREVLYKIRELCEYKERLRLFVDPVLIAGIIDFELSKIDTEETRQQLRETQYNITDIECDDIPF